MNKVILIGNLTHSPKITRTPNGTSVCKFRIAVQRNYPTNNSERITDFFSCTSWRTAAENIARYCLKGSKIAIIGALETNAYTDKEGKNHSSIEINVTEVQFLSSQPKDNSNELGMTPVEEDELPF